MLSFLKKVIKKGASAILSNDFIDEVLHEKVYAQLNQIEYRSFNRRFYAIEQIADYMVGAQVIGDYCEFGVYKGDTFAHAYKWLSPHFKNMQFYAFDSFEGLPEPKGIDNVQGYTSNFKKNEFLCSLEDFKNNLHNAKVDTAHVSTIKGWFDTTLTKDKAASYPLKKISIAWIDCDLYESTVPVLDFITPYLTTGSVIVFDDWRCYRNDPDLGEQKACREWLQRNPQIKLAELFSFGWNGMVFTAIVNS